MSTNNTNSDTSYDDDSEDIFSSSTSAVEHSEDLIDYFRGKNLVLHYIESSNNSVVSRLLPLNPSDPISAHESMPYTSMVIKEICHNQPGVHNQQCDDLKNELNKLNLLDHSHIIKPASNTLVELEGGCAILLPRAEMDLFDLIYDFSNCCVPGSLANQVEDQLLLDVPLVRRCLSEIGSALFYLHNTKYLVHNDVKVENILVFEENHFKLADFGFCRRPKQYSCHAEFFNEYQHRNFQFLPPEFTECFQDRDQPLDLINEYSADVFGLGVVLFHYVFKQLPYNEQSEYYCEPKQPKMPFDYKEQIRETGIADEIDKNEIKQQDVKISKTRIYYHQRDAIYKYLYTPNDVKKFWAFYSGRIQFYMHQGVMVQQEINILIDLLTRALTPFNYLRISLPDFLNHPWFRIVRI